MIILYSKQATVMRVPKTGSTSLEASIRIAGGVGPDDYCTSIEDALLPSRNEPEAYSEYQESRRIVARRLNTKILDARAANTEPVLDDEEQNLRDTARARRIADTFERMGLHHGTLDDLTDENSFGDMGFLTEEQVYAYDHYAMLRNPIRRVLSSFVFSRSRNRRIPFGIEDFHKTVLDGDLTGLVYRDQHHYHQYQGEYLYNGGRIVTPTVFETYKDSVDGLISIFGGSPLAELPRFKSDSARGFDQEDAPSVGAWITAYPKIKEAILARYSKDVELWESVTGKTL